MPSDRLTYLVYRCVGCHRLLTKLEIIEVWESQEAAGITTGSKGICPCGSGKVSPTNAALWEEIFLPRVWRLWWHEIVLPKWRRWRGVA